jgi:hypothetical protein
MSLTVRRAGVVAVALLAGASILRASTSAAFALSNDTAADPVPSPTQPAPHPSPQALALPSDTFAGSSSATGLSSGDPNLPGTLMAPSVDGLWAVRVHAKSIRAAASLMLRSRLMDGASSGTVVVVGVRLGGGKKETVVTNAATVGQLLRAMGVRLGAHDAVQPGSRAPLVGSRRIRVTRVRRETRTVAVSIPFQTVIRYSADLSTGQRVLNRSGAPGRGERTYLLTYRNGKLVSQTTVATRIVVAPVPQIVLQGTAQHAPGSKIGIASWYGCSGYHAASPFLPFGTVVTVTNVENGRSVNVVINDRGPYGAGRIIDLCSPAFAAIAPLDQGLAKVRTTW